MKIFYIFQQMVLKIDGTIEHIIHIESLIYINSFESKKSSLN